MNSVQLGLLVFFVLFVFILFGGVFGWIVGHEAGHVQIDKYSGVESVVEYDFSNLVYPAKTIPLNDCKFNCSERFLAHGINEVIGYQLVPLFIMLEGTIFLSVIYLKHGSD